jgi:protein-S-isoprenylcysteine O-methyltransferase Ste14
MDRMQRRALSSAAVGLGLVVAGVGWDTVWHSRHEDGDVGGATELLQAHWLMFLGVLVIALSTLVAVVRAAPRPPVPTLVTFAGSMLAIVGFGWDSVRHAQGTESVPGHVLIYVGLVVVAAGLVMAAVTGRRMRDSSAAG